MNLEELERKLQSIGKRTFRNSYEMVKEKGEALTKDDLLKCDPDLVGTTESGLNTRLSCIRWIFRADLQEQALKLAKSAKNYDGD